jgi:hypothetical protein
MKLTIPKLGIAPQNFLHKCGYIEIRNPHKDNEISYARSLDPGRFYPRFHAYLDENGKEFTINLHMDAKKPSYAGTAAHSGEYDSPVVEKEAARIKVAAENFIFKAPVAPLGFKKERSLWEKLTGFWRRK